MSTLALGDSIKVLVSPLTVRIIVPLCLLLPPFDSGLQYLKVGTGLLILTMVSILYFPMGNLLQQNEGIRVVLGLAVY